MKEKLVYLAIALLAIILYVHKSDINNLQERISWLESVTFDSSRCPTE
jgi:hypothetical protein